MIIHNHHCCCYHPLKPLSYRFSYFGGWASHRYHHLHCHQCCHHYDHQVVMAVTVVEDTEERAAMVVVVAGNHRIHDEHDEL